MDETENYGGSVIFLDENLSFVCLRRSEFLKYNDFGSVHDSSLRSPNFQFAIMGRMQSFEKSTSSPIEESAPPAPVKMSNAEVKSRKRRKLKKVEWGDAGDGDIEWAKSLSDCQLDLMVSVKQLAMERVRSTREKSLNGLLTPAGLRAIGIILEEFIMDRVQTLRNAPDSPSSVIDDLRACMEKSEDECTEINHVEPATEADERS